MNSNYVKKCTEFLQNIQAHKPAATNIAAAGVAVAHTDPSCFNRPQQPQSNRSEPGPNNSASKKTSRRGRPAAGAFGVGKRPVWHHAGTGPTAGFPRPSEHSQLPTHNTAQQKFVRSCCPSRRPDTSQPGRGRVDCRWDEQPGKHPPVLGDMIADPIQEGRGDADNVNHSDGIGQTNVRSTVEIPTIVTGDADTGHNRPPEECQDRQPLSWSGILSKPNPLPSVNERKNDTNSVQDNTECPNCQLLQRNWQDERHRHALESAQLTEQINYLQKQLRVNNKAEQRMEEAMKERYHSMEQDITKLKLAVDEKNLKLVLINDLKRNLKEMQSKLKRVDQERAEMEKRLMVAQLENQKLELFLDAQALHLRKVKSELGHIHRLSIKQIEFLDEEPTDDALTLVDTGSVTIARHRRHPSLHNYAPAVQSSECDTDATPIQSHSSSPGMHLTDYHRTVARRNEPKHSSSSKSPRIVLEASTKRKSHSRSNTTFTPEESIPSLVASDSDRDNADRVRMRKAASSASTASSRTVVSGDDNRKHNECADHLARINRADHDDNRIRHRASVSDYNADAGCQKLTAVSDSDAVVKWQRDDKERHRIASRSTSRSCATDDTGDKYRAECSGRRTMATYDDDQQQFVVELDENITLPVSPRPFQHNLSIAPLSEDDSLTSSASLS
ncbi:uncharacterized protein LOC126561800 [Anopheles maculipalpis]|uniref:uncharacterized protein LOC126561800 n=1 Tax=Anopheles maculipalpis TaxID=1496333 RepID=UPI0021597DA5|nr:uncharacterized protein LOC126561800 [Anopheles maculipalpis]